jgi:cleavage and polyadenylation specificity factor subunit 2
MQYKAEMDTIKFIPILNKQEHGCTCSILYMNNIVIMLECGHPEVGHLTAGVLETLTTYIQQANVVLLSHDLLSHLGSVPLFAKHPQRNRVILTTSPVCKLGHLLLYDYFYSRNLVEHFDMYTLEQVDQAFESMKTVKYKEKYTFKGRLHDTSM